MLLLSSRATFLATEAELLGKRALLLLNVLLGLDEGYSKVCAGSGMLEADAARERLRHEKSMVEWGLPVGAAPTEYVANASGSGKLKYTYPNGSVKAFQYGSWLARREVQKGLARLLPLLHAQGLGDYIPHVHMYLAAAHAVLRRYGRVSRRPP